MVNRKYIVGTNYFSYPQIRNFVELPFKNFFFKKIYDLFKLFDFMYFNVFKKNNPFFLNSFLDGGLNKVDLLHFFNCISFSTKPWIVTFEHTLPRNKFNLEAGLKALSSQSCKRIIALSNYALESQKMFLNGHLEYREKILMKTIIIHPPQKLHVEEAERNDSKNIIFAFIGSSFFRKGGREIINVFENLIIEKYPVQLNIVSNFEYGKWKDFHINKTDVENVKKIISKYPEQIKHYYYLPNDKVIELYKNSHVGLLPSYGETYGYSVLEAQGCGCPVVTTDLPPFDEFNNNDMGWVIKVPKILRDGGYTSDVYSANGRMEFSKKLEDELLKIVKNICEEPEQIFLKAIKSIENIKVNHNQKKTAEVLEKIYLEAINND